MAQKHGVYKYGLAKFLILCISTLNIYYSWELAIEQRNNKHK